MTRPPIILEGPDGSGKTTLARYLAERTGLPIIKFVGHPSDKFAMIDYMANRPAIWDRYQLTPRIYGQVLRGKSEFTKLDEWALEGLLTNLSALVFVCAPRFWHDLSPAEDGAEAGRLEDLWGAFIETLFEEVPPRNRRRYNFKKSNALEEAYATYEEWREEHWQSPVPGMLGSHTPKYLLVGEERRHSDDLTDHVPFWGPNVPDDRLISSSLVVRGMKALELDWRNTAVVNSRAFGKERDMCQLLGQFVTDPKVIALGNVASSRLWRQGIEHHKVPHPQYWRRFHHHDENRYYQLLREAIA